MSNHIETYKGQVFITEQTLRELVKAVEEAKSEDNSSSIDILRF